jgi:hypothetical protein
MRPQRCSSSPVRFRRAGSRCKPRIQFVLSTRAVGFLYAMVAEKAPIVRLRRFGLRRPQQFQEFAQAIFLVSNQVPRLASIPFTIA